MRHRRVRCSLLILHATNASCGDKNSAQSSSDVQTSSSVAYRARGRLASLNVASQDPYQGVMAGGGQIYRRSSTIAAFAIGKHTCESTHRLQDVTVEFLSMCADNIAECKDH